MQRRAFVASTGGALAALGGCLGTRPSQRADATAEPTSTATDEPTSTAPDEPTSTATDEPTSTADVTVESVHLQHGVVTPTSPDSIGVSNTDTPYLVVSVRVDGSLSWEAFGLRVADVRYSPTRLDRLYRTSWGDDSWYEAGRSEGLLLFEAPPGPTRHLRLQWPGGERAVDDDLVARIRAPAPPFSASLDVPTRHDDGTAPPVDVTVTNEGETAGRFLGALNRVGPQVAYTPVARLSELVPAGETVTRSVSDSWGGLPPADRRGDDTPDVTYYLRFAGGEASAEISVGSSS